MICLSCSSKTAVMESRELKDGTVVRRRRCKSCNDYFYTVEHYIDYEEIADELNEIWNGGTHERKRNRVD